jgi:hypothetical protein
MAQVPYARLTVDAEPVLPARPAVVYASWQELRTAVTAFVHDLIATFEAAEAAGADEAPDDLYMELEPLLEAVSGEAMRDAIERTGRSQWVLSFDGVPAIGLLAERLTPTEPAG